MPAARRLYSLSLSNDSIRARVWDETPRRPFNTLETVDTDTSASAATSANVSRPDDSSVAESLDTSTRYFQPVELAVRPSSVPVRGSSSALPRLECPAAGVDS